MNSRRFFRILVGLVVLLNVVQGVHAYAEKQNPTSLDYLEAQLMVFEKQTASLGNALGVTSHEALEKHWIWKPLVEKFQIAKKDIETISKKDTAMIHGEAFTERALVRYFGLQLRLYLAYARLAHYSHGYGLSFSFKHLEQFNLKIHKDSAQFIRVRQPHNLRHVGIETIEMFLTSQDEQLAEFAALMNPRDTEDYLAALQLSAVRASVVNRWALDQAYTTLPPETALERPTPRFLSFPGLQGKRISETKAYQELNVDMRYYAFASLRSELAKVIRKHPISSAIGFRDALFHRLDNSDAYFEKNQNATKEDTYDIADFLKDQLKVNYLKHWDENAETLIRGSSLLGDSWKAEDIVQRLLDDAFDYLQGWQAVEYTNWLYANGYSYDDQNVEFERSIKLFGDFRDEWEIAVRPELMKLIQAQAKDAWANVRKEIHNSKMQYVYEQMIPSIWKWNILLEAKNIKTDLVNGLPKKTPNEWQLTQIQSAEDAKLYFYITTERQGLRGEEGDGQWFWEFFDGLGAYPDDGAAEGVWKERIQKHLNQHVSIWKEQWMKAKEVGMLGPKDKVPAWKKPRKQELIETLFHLGDKTNRILQTPEEYVNFVEAKRDELFSRVGVLRILRKDAVAMARIEAEHKRQIKDYNDFQARIHSHGTVQYAGSTISPKMPEPDDLFLSLIRAWKDDQNLRSDSSHQRFFAEIKTAYDGARRDASNKLENLFSIQTLNQSDFNENHRLILMSTESVRQTFIQANEKFKSLDEKLMKITRSSGERANDFLNTTVLYLFYAILAVGAAALVVSSNGFLYPVLQGLLSAGVIAINVMGVANIITRTTVDFVILPPQMQYQVEYANLISVSARQESQQGIAPVLEKKEDQSRLDLVDEENHKRIDQALTYQKGQSQEKYLGIVWSLLDMTGYTEVVKSLKPFTKMGRLMKAKVVRYQRHAKFQKFKSGKYPIEAAPKKKPKPSIKGDIQDAPTMLKDPVPLRMLKSGAGG